MTVDNPVTRAAHRAAAGAAESPDVAHPKTSRKRLLPLVAVVVLGGAYGGYRYIDHRRPYEWSGTVEVRDISIGSRVGGRIKEVLVHEGERVSAGQPLVTLETGDLEAQRLMAEGQLVQTQATLDKLVAGARPEELEQAKARAANASAALEQSRHGARSEEIAQAEARLATTQAGVDKAQMDADRARRLVASGAIAQAEADGAETALKSALGQRDAQRHVLDELKNGVRREEIHQAEARAIEARAQAKLVASGSRSEDIRAAQGLVDAARGKLEQVRVMIDELTIRAPVAARVESLDLRPGDILGPNATAAELVEDDQLYVRIYVPETKIGLLHIGDAVPVIVDSFPNRSFSGVIEHINSVGEYSPRNLQTADERADQVFATRIGLREGKDVLRAGMAAFIHVPK